MKTRVRRVLSVRAKRPSRVTLGVQTILFVQAWFLTAVILLPACLKIEAAKQPPGGTGGAIGGTGGSGGTNTAAKGSGGATQRGVVGATDARDASSGDAPGGGQCVTSCMPTGGQWCGTIGDNCGGKFECPACSGDWSCKNNLCVGPDTCPRSTCTVMGGQYCGTIGDGCGGKLDCGDCPNGGECGGGGVAHLCKPANCVPRGCKDAASGGQYCGDVGDGCGGLLHCGDCPDGKACGSEGLPNVCPGTGCKHFQCTIAADACPTDAPTTLTGTVRDPAGRLPLYNALVYVPNDPLPLPAIPDGVTCGMCAAFAAGTPVAAALTDVNGRFTLKGVPSGKDIPLVIQVGKWRREVTLKMTVNRCTANAITDANLTRLPRNKSEGHIPRIAVTTGGLDALECLLRRIGIADEEFTTDTGTGRVHLYAGGATPTTSGTGGAAGGGGPGMSMAGATQFSAQLGGARFSAATILWAAPTKLQSYDIMMLSCEGDEQATVKAPYVTNVSNYLNQGGRVFADHYHYYWMKSGPAELRGTATYAGALRDPPAPSTAQVDTSFPKGVALADWLVATGASAQRGQLAIYGAQHSVTAVAPATQRWIYLEQNPNDPDKRPSIQYMTFNTPVTAAPENQCGRVVFTDIHIAAQVPNPAGGSFGGDTSSPGMAFPAGCATTDMSPQAKALEFMFFDLSACVTKNEVPPVPPPPEIPPPTVPVPPPPPPPPPVIP